MEDLWNTKFYLFMWMSALPAHVSVQRVPYGGHGYQKSVQNSFKREPQMVVCRHAGGLNQSPGRAIGAFHHRATSLSPALSLDHGYGNVDICYTMISN